MKITILRATKIDGKTYGAGDAAEVETSIGLQLVNMGKAQPHEEAAPVVEDRSVGLTTKSAKGLIKRKKKAD